MSVQRQFSKRALEMALRNDLVSFIEKVMRTVKKSCRHRVELVPVVLDKVTRLWNQAAKFANGRVFLPEQAPFRGIVEKELLTFPKAQTNDIVDSISQALAYEGSSYTLAYVR